jgi:hypothetical protein
MLSASSDFASSPHVFRHDGHNTFNPAEGTAVFELLDVADVLPGADSDDRPWADDLHDYVSID